MIKQFSSFSPEGDTFIFGGSDGKLKIWDSASGILKQEFVPNLHLNQPCTALIWLYLSKSTITTLKVKKKRIVKRASKTLALGANNGSVALYGVSEGKVTCTLQGGHSSAVTSLAWSSKNGLFSVSENTVIVWDVENKAVKSKWKCGKGKVSAIAVCEDADLCVTGSYKLKLWDVNTQLLLNTFTGHATEITSIKFFNEKHFVSVGSGDRHISVWSAADEGNLPVVRMALGDSASGDLQTLSSDGLCYLSAVTSSGVLQHFSHQFNGKVSKSVKASCTVELAGGEGQVNGTAEPVQPLPIVAVHLSSSNSALIAYGHSPLLTFETIDLKQTEKRIYLVRAVKKPPTVSLSQKVGEEVGSEVEWVGVGSKRGRGDTTGVREVPLEERLGVEVGGPTEAEEGSAGMARLLAQALDSGDKHLLGTVLMRREAAVIRQTVSRISPRHLQPLLVHLTSLIRSKTLTSSVGVEWLRWVVVSHAAQLLADDTSLQTLSEVHALVQTRLGSLPRLLSLAGRLDLLLEQVQGQADSLLIDQNALLLYQDEDSSEEGGSVLGGERSDLSESEDKWEELSEQDTEDANMST